MKTSSYVWNCTSIFQDNNVYLCENKNFKNPKTKLYNHLASQLVLSAINVLKEKFFNFYIKDAFFVRTDFTINLCYLILHSNIC